MAEPKRLTATAIQNAIGATRPKRGNTGDTPRVTSDRWLSDDVGSRGGGRLVCRVTPNGVATFYFRYSIDGVRKHISLGLFSAKETEGRLTLEQARAEHRRYETLHRREESRDVIAYLARLKEEAKQREEAEAEAERLRLEAMEVESKFTLLALCKMYSANLRKRGKDSSGVDSKIRCHIEPTEWANVPAAQFKRAQAATLLARIIDKGHGRTAGQVRSMLLAAYNMALSADSDPLTVEELNRFRIEYNPIAGVKALSRFNVALDRHLSERELGHFWHLLWQQEDPVPLAIRALRLDLLLGGQRAEQLLRVKRSDVNWDEGTITLYDPKGRRTEPYKHIIPLVDRALVEVEFLDRRREALGSQHLFASEKKNRKKDEQRPGEFSSVMSGATMTNAVRAISDQLLEEKKIQAPVQFRDIRRTIETRLSAKDVSDRVRAEIQSHGRGGVQRRHYDKHDYLRQKFDTLVMWEEYLDQCAQDRDLEPAAFSRLRRVA